MVRYIKEMYQLDAFTQSNPADQDIINIYKQQQGVKYSFVNITINLINNNNTNNNSNNTTTTNNNNATHTHTHTHTSTRARTRQPRTHLSTITPQLCDHCCSV